MIELELKYELDGVPNAVEKLKINKKKEQKDIYYDTPNYDLIRGGNFLRIRNEKSLEFKLFAGDSTHLFCQETDFNLDNIDSDKEKINSILSSLKLKTVKDLNSFNQICDYNNLKILAPIVKQRTSYEYKNNSTISIDIVNNLGLYLEAEIMLDNDSLSNSEADKIKSQFITDLQNSGILTGREKSVNIGYVELYLLKYNLEAYNLGLYKI